MAEVLQRNWKGIDEFCKHHGISKQKLRKQWALGIGPHRTLINAEVRIYDEDADAWVEQMRHPTGKAAQIAAQTQAMLKAKAQKGGAAAAIVHRQKNAERKRQAAQEQEQQP